MGFLSGLLGGATLTSALLYLHLSSHQRQRAQQSALLRQQATLLRSLVDEPSEHQHQPPQQSERLRASSTPGPLPLSLVVRRHGLVAMAKDRWNRELAAVVRAAQDWDWDWTPLERGGRLLAEWARGGRAGAWTATLDDRPDAAAAPGPGPGPGPAGERTAGDAGLGRRRG
ncbi:MAG: hypothetical protein M1826_001503 [Phylliscum demangeonii]|nr:MAG: hypothetical protein M1826_001503 [Phylliscum demangeonii]